MGISCCFQNITHFLLYGLTFLFDEVCLGRPTSFETCIHGMG